MNIFNSLIKTINHPNNRSNRIRTLKRILWWKFNQIYFHLPAIVDLTDNIKCICYPNSSFGSLIVYTKYPEFNEMNLVIDVLDSDSVFIDVGANIGIYSLLAASKSKKSKIFAFEPSVDALKVFYENIYLNNLNDQIQVFDQVVSDKIGSVKFNVTKISETNHLPYNEQDSSIDQVVISSITLDSFCKVKKIKHVNFLKIDVEGAEYKVLLGSIKLLQDKKIDFLNLELNKNNKLSGHNSDEIIDIIKNNGYRIYTYIGDNKLMILVKENLDFSKTFDVLAVNPTRKNLKKIKHYLTS